MAHFFDFAGLFRAGRRPKFDEAEILLSADCLEAASNARKFALYATFSTDGALFSHHFDQARSLQKAGYFVIAARAASRFSSAAKTQRLGDVDILKPNIGYDFGSWWFAIQWIKQQPQIDRTQILSLCLLNDSYFGHFGSETIQRISALDGDLVGASESMQGRRHIQSFFMMGQNRLLTGDRLMNRIDRYPFSSNKKTAIQMGEMGLTKSVLKAGLVCNQMLNYQDMARVWTERLDTIRSEELEAREEIKVRYDVNELDAQFKLLSDKLSNGKGICPHHFFWEAFLDVDDGVVKRDTLTYGHKFVPSFYSLLRQLSETELYDQIKEQMLYNGRGALDEHRTVLVDSLEKFRVNRGLPV